MNPPYKGPLFAAVYLISPTVSQLIALSHPPGQSAEILGAGTRCSSCTFALRNTFRDIFTFCCLLLVSTQAVLTPQENMMIKLERFSETYLHM